MSNRRTMILPAVLLAALPFSNALAQPEPAKSDRPVVKREVLRDKAVARKTERKLDRADNRQQNRQDRRLDAAEAKFDANHDGKLDPSERDAMKAALKDRVAQHKSAIDANHDGKISAEEWKAAYPDLPSFGQDMADEFKGENVKGFLLNRFDANRDGKLDEGEKAAAKTAWEDHRLELIARFDANADGKLDEAERKALLQSLRERREEKRESGAKADAENH